MFQGNTLQIFKHALFAVALSGVVTSLGLMGPAWTHFLSFASVLIIPLLFLSMPLVRWANRFAFNDEKAEIVKPGGKRIPYGRIRGFLVLERGETIDVYARQGRLHTTALVQSLDAGERTKISDELLLRFPGAVVETKRRPRYVLVLALPALLVLILAGAHGFLYHRYPSLEAAPRIIKAAEAGKKERLKHQPRSRAGDFLFELPAGYTFVGEGEGTLSFEERSQKARLEIITKIKRDSMVRHAFWYRYGMGVRDFTDLTALLLRARYGLVPLFLRALALTGQEDVILYETAAPLLRGYITQGRHGREELTHIFLSGGHKGKEIHIYITGPTRVPEETLRLIITGIRQEGLRPSDI